MMDLKFIIRLNEIVEIDMGEETVYLSARCLVAGGDDNAHYIDLQAIGKDGKCKIFEMRKIKNMPKGWKKSGYTRFKFKNHE